MPLVRQRFKIEYVPFALEFTKEYIIKIEVVNLNEIHLT